MKGTIYVFSYPTYVKTKQWFKIGLTSREAKTRISEQGSGIPEKAQIFKEYIVEVENTSELHTLESNIHKSFKLKDKWVKEGGGKEWFGPTSLDEIHDVVEECIYNLSIEDTANELMEYSPRKCQIKGEPALRKGLREYDKVQIACATGTGKTILMYSIVRNTNKTVLFLAPTISLVEQSYREWKRFENINAMIVCSDEDVTEDDVIISTRVNQIESFLNNKIDSQLNVIFGTYHSADKISQAQDLADVRFDIAFYDEAHKTVTNSNGRNHMPVLDNVIKADKKVFATATRKVADHDRGVRVTSMNDEQVYGKLVYELTTKEAIEKGWSVPFETYMIEVGPTQYVNTLELVIEEIENNEEIYYNEELMKARHLSSLASILKCYNELGSKKIATFHTFNKSAKQFARLIKALKLKNLLPEDMLIRELTSENNASFRSSYLANEFCDSDNAIITSAKWMREGVDIPCLDTIILVDPIGTGIACQQTVGRALRIDENNPDKVAKIIIPAVIGEDISTFRDTTALSVLSNMYNLDENVVYNFQTTSSNGQTSISNTTFRVIEDEEIPDSRRVELQEYYNSIALRSLGLANGNKEKTQEIIDEVKDLFEKYIEENGTKYPYVEDKKVTDFQIKEFIKGLDTETIAKIWTRHANNEKNFLFHELRYGGSYTAKNRVKAGNDGGRDQRFKNNVMASMGMKNIIAEGYLNFIFNQDINMNGRNSEYIKGLVDNLNKELEPHALTFSISLIYQRLKAKIIEKGSDAQLIINFGPTMAERERNSFYNLLVKPITKRRTIDREDFKDLVLDIFGDSHLNKFNKSLTDVCNKKNIKIITHNGQSNKAKKRREERMKQCSTELV